MIYQRVPTPSPSRGGAAHVQPEHATTVRGDVLAARGPRPASHSIARISGDAVQRASSGGVLQLMKYKQSEIRRMVREAAKTAQPNRVALLLEVYNQMRYEIDPTPVAFTTVLAGRTALIAANRIDAEDADALDAEATQMQQAGGDAAEATRIRIEGQIAAGRGATEGAYAQHIFQGDTKAGVPTGYHSTVDGSATHEACGTATNLANTSAGGNAAYQQSVRLQAGARTRKPIQSTFFPDDATHNNVIDAITAVYTLGMKTVAYVADTVNGLKLAKRGDTVFPAG